MRSPSRPPGLARKLLRVASPEEIREEVVDDLEEQYRKEGGGRAGWYWRRALLYSLRFATAGVIDSASSVIAAAVQPDWTQDLRQATRSLWRSWAFSAAVVAILGIGLGSATAIFSIYYGILLRPFPYPAPDELVRLDWMMTSGQSQGSSLGDFQIWERGARSFARLGVYSSVSIQVRGVEGPAEAVSASYVSSGTLAALGVNPQIGRLFSALEDVPNGDVHKAILSDSLWKRRFGGDPAVLGRTIRLSGKILEIVAVMPAGFAFPNNTEMWIPVESYWAGSNPVKRASVRSYAVLGRLGRGFNLDAAREEIRALSTDAQGTTDLSPRVGTLRAAETGQLRPYLVALLSGVGCLVLICIANICSLQIARGAARQREFAVRAAIGASVGRNLRAQLAESLLLGLGAAILGSATAAIAAHAIVATIPVKLPAWMRLETDPVAFAFCFALAAAAATIAGVLPAWRASRQDPSVLIRAGGRGRTDRSGLRKGLVAAEVGLSTVLLVCSLLMIETLFELHKRDPGFRPQGLLTIRVTREQLGTLPARSRILAQMHEGVLERLQALPGVSAVCVTNRLPFTSGETPRTIADLTVGGMSGGTQRKVSHFVSSDVGTGYFATMGIPIVKGRSFTRHDNPDEPPVLIVNERAARMLWPNRDPIGQQVTWGVPRPDNPPATVVGVAGDVRNHASEADRGLEFYYPYAQFASDSAFYVIRTSAFPESLSAAARRTIQETEPSIAVSVIKQMPQWIEESLWQTRLWSWLLGAFATVALVLAAAGLYGVVTYLVLQRSKEMVIRISLGATAGRISALLLGGMLQPVAFGLVSGIAGSLAISKFLGTIAQISPTDLRTYAVVSATIAGVALAACCPPILRASRVDPAAILKEE